MLGFGPPADRQARQEWWRRQIQRQRDGNLSIVEFCRRLGVSTVTFYHWKRRLREASPAPLLPSEKPTPTDNAALPPPFLPVSIRETMPSGQLEVTLANACVVRLTGAIDPELLRIAIHSAGQFPSGQRGVQ